MNRFPVAPEPDHAAPAFDEARWAARRSISELAADERRRLSPESWADADGDTGLCDLYARMYEKHIGRKPALRDKLPVVRAMNAAARYCEQHGLDLPLYVAAQMVALRDWATRSKVGFHPNMLLGPAALGRYNAHARRAGRRYHHAAEGALSDADKGLREFLYADELSMGAEMTAHAVNGTPVLWGAVVSTFAPSAVWWAAASGMKSPTGEARALYLRLARDHGPVWLAAALRLARLDAACAVADRYAPALSDRVGVGPAGFSWPAFADLMAAVFARDPAPAPSPELAGFGLKKWG